MIAVNVVREMLVAIEEVSRASRVVSANFTFRQLLYDGVRVFNYRVACRKCGRKAFLKTRLHLQCVSWVHPCANHEALQRAAGLYAPRSREHFRIRTPPKITEIEMVLK